MAVIKKQTLRDYLRNLITKINTKAGVKFNSSKLNSVKECEEYIFELVKNLKIEIDKKYIAQINELEQEIKLQREKVNLHLGELKEAYAKIKNLEVKLANVDNSKALYKEIDALKEEIEILTKANFDLTMKNKEFEDKNVTALFLKEAQETKVNLELQKFYKKAFAGALVVSVIINILLIWGNL